MRVALRPRDFVRVAGPDAPDLLQRMVSNDVDSVAVDGVCDALLLTAKGRVIAPLRVWRRGADDFLLLTEPGLGDVVARTLLRARLRAQAEIEREEHTSYVVFGGNGGIPTSDYGEPAVEVIDAELEPTLDGSELERMRIEAATPAWGAEIDESILPAEAGLDETHISWTKGCYPGQEPVARLHYRGHPNRGLRLLRIDADPGDELIVGEKVVGRVTSAADGLALAYVRREVPEGADLRVARGSSASTGESYEQEKKLPSR